jgi:nucleoside-diphosphate-sugar epimerase
MNCLVTGFTGFLGNAIVGKLKDLGDTVVGKIGRAHV